MMKHGAIVLLVITSAALGSVDAFSPMEKARLVARNLLHGLAIKSNVRNFEPRKFEKDYEEVACVEDFSATCANDKDAYIGSMFESYKYRLNQLENNAQKYNRIKRFYKVIQNKKSKLNDFKNTSLWLKAVVGGDVDNPNCEGDTGGETVTELYYNLAGCNESLPAGCNDDTTVLEIDQGVFDSCFTLNEEIIEKISECNEIDLTDEEGKCQCFDNAMFRIDSFKTLEYQMATPEGTVAKKCFDAFKDAAPKVTKQYRECISALQFCKKEEDKAISVLNSCNSATSRGVVVSHYRAFMDAEEDLQAQFEEDMDYVDYDY